MSKISVVINTLNEGKNIERAIKSVSWVDEIVVVDMHSNDKTVEKAKRLGAKVFYHKKTGYVEPARNSAISKASGDWILVLDADEEISQALAYRLRDIADKMKQIDFVGVPRKNIIFGRWMRASMWWPDVNIRFFKKEKVVWKDQIHSEPKTTGNGIMLEAKEELAILHHNYESISQFLERMSRYTEIQAKELINQGYKFKWQDLISKPLREFLSRYFAKRGFDDGIHGLALGMLQAFSFLAIYLRVWEVEKFNEKSIGLGELKELSAKSGQEINYWFKYGNLSSNTFKRFFQKVKNKIT